MHPSGHDRRGPATDPRQGKARTPKPTEFFANRLVGQIGFVLAVVLGVVSLVVVVGSLGDPAQIGMRYIAIGILVALGSTGVYVYVQRRRGRQSLNDALRSRRSQD